MYKKHFNSKIILIEKALKSCDFKTFHSQHWLVNPNNHKPLVQMYMINNLKRCDLHKYTIIVFEVVSIVYK